MKFVSTNEMESCKLPEGLDYFSAKAAATRIVDLPRFNTNR